MIGDLLQKILPEISKDETKRELGDRSTYIGASDVVGCPRKVVLSKLTEQEFSINTLIKFRRGHLAEEILKEVFARTKYKWKAQVEMQHPNYNFIKAHLDFMFHTKDYSSIGVIEQKSVSRIPSQPYENWVEQIQFQMGLVKLLYPKAEVRGVIFCIDLNAGDIKEFPVEPPVDALFDALVDKAKRIYEKVQQKETENLETEMGNLCAYCPFKDDCPEFTGDEKDIPADLLNLVKQYKKASKIEKKIKAKKDAVKNSILEFTGDNFFAKFSGNRLSIKQTSSERVNTKALKENYPEVYEEVKKTSSFISFRLT